MSESQRTRSKRSTASTGANKPGEGGPDASGPMPIPLPLTSLVGRERDIAQVTTFLQSEESRLLTLTGPGGVGKTRLALQVAADARVSFSDGVYFIPLAPVTNPELVLSTIAQTLGVPEAAGQPLFDSLCAALRDKRLLLVLDNFEQVDAAGPRVLDLLQRAPRLQALVTSRHVLHVYGEQEYQVSPLALPDPKRDLSLEQLTQYEAVRLFIQRAHSIKSSFSVNNDSARAVAEICRRLDGLPLAIELAAARIKLMSPQALLQRLDRTLPLLTRGATTLPYRHQTLRDAVAWSYDLLSDEEQRLFRCLSCFVGGCALEAIAAVCDDRRRVATDEGEGARPAAGNSGPNAHNLLDTLAALVDKSLLRQIDQEDGEPRFLMLETIREFALEQLIEAGEEESVSKRHTEFFLALAEEAEPHLPGPEQLAWANRIETEHDNLRAALTTLLSMPQPAPSGWAGLRLAGATWQFWAMRGYLSEGRGWLQLARAAATRLQESDPQTLLSAGIGTEELARAQLKALNGMGVLAQLAGDFPAAREALERGLKTAGEIGDQQAVALTLSNLGRVAMMRGDYDDARRFLEECLTIRLGLGRELEAGYSLTNLGNVAMMVGDYAEARRLHEEGLEIKRRAGDRQGIGQSLHSLATIALREGDYAGARRLNEETLAIARELGNKPGIAYSLRDLGHVACEQGDYPGAYKSFRESLTLFRDLGNFLPIIECLIGIARVTAHMGEPAQAIRLLGAAHAMLESTEGQLDPPGRADYERSRSELRARLGDVAFNALWDEGSALTLEEALTLAHGATPTATPTPPTRPRNVPGPGSDLTPREVEVLQLVTAGLTNPGIAAHLHLSIGTVQTHLSSIFSKINVKTRSAAVRYAFEHGLV